MRRINLISSDTNEKIELKSKSKTLFDEEGTRGIYRNLEVSSLKPYSKHFFKIYSDEKMEELIESIKDNGLMQPIITRQNGKYNEILSGHNRVEAYKKIGYETIPAIFYVDMNDDEAEKFVIETNLNQRGWSDLSYYEKIEIVRYKKRTKKIVELAEDENISKRTWSYYIKLLNLKKEFVDLLDNEKISFNKALLLSELSLEFQNMIYEVITENKIKLNDDKLKLIIKKYNQRNLKLNDIKDLLISKNKNKEIKLPNINKSFNKKYNKKELQNNINNLINKLLDDERVYENFEEFENYLLGIVKK